ncbi:ATP-binding cassette domain-containing protein [Cohnella sp. JJ-181]|uniref:ATP-binding cassette domain-containing protein n=1 Tax=Cohnella rhizoplanae TaxID=2974897 RepID=UPI0022FFBA2F|nr:ABC transporter ATP-binding protein [Cohnella sp. JJ-181]CAI6085267.1 Vitamin B12 import ATP-binding protein BtuD [Cohnella sp. JJ-181]
MRTNAILRLEKASKHYKGKAVLDDVSIALNRGETVAITGPNGSGKSTLLKLLAGLSALSSGTRELNGGGGGDRMVIGYAPDHLPKLKFTAREYLNHMAAIRGLDAATRLRRIEELLEQVNLRDRPGQQMRYFSKGMLQKVNLVQALLGEPELLLLDEPIGGLDEEAQSVLGGMLRSLRLEGMAVVVAGHEHAILRQWADRIISISDGRIVAVEDSPLSVGEIYWRRIVCRWPAGRETEAAALGRLSGMLQYRLEDRTTAVYWADAERSDALLRELLEAGASVDSVAMGTGRMI